MQSRIVAVIPTLMLLLLSACAQTETKPVKPQDNPPPVQTPSRQEPQKMAAPASAPAAAEPQGDAVANTFIDHTVIEFDDMSRELGDSARETIALLGGSAQRARQIVITGYCDRHTVSNAKEVALSRAMAVKNELVNFGAARKSIRVKYSTAQPKHEVTIDLIEK